MSTRLFKASEKKPSVDTKNGIIEGVSVMTIGPALGHGIDIDSTGLHQCLDACLAHGDEGVKLIYVHTGDDDSGQIRDIVGSVKNFRIEGLKLLGDAYLLASAPSRNFILELAEKMPSEFGLSVETEGEHESIPNTKKKLYRCTDISAIALVPRPAANPTGLFTQKKETKMDEEQMKTMFGAMLSEALTPISERLAKLEEGEEKPEDEKPDEEHLEEGEEKPEGDKKETGEEKMSRIANRAANAVLTKFTAQLGLKKAPVSVPSHGAKGRTKFEALVEEAAQNGAKNPFSATVMKHPDEYNEYRAQLEGKR